MLVHMQVWKLVALLSLTGAASSAFASIQVLQPGAAAGKDAEIDTAGPTNNFGDNSSLIINWGGVFRSIGLIEFDLSSIPSGSTINSATLSLYHHSNSNNQGRTYDLFRVTSAWSEATVTFNTAPTFNGVAAASMTI